jgi:hypothetical protein
MYVCMYACVCVCLCYVFVFAVKEKFIIGQNGREESTQNTTVTKKVLRMQAIRSTVPIALRAMPFATAAPILAQVALLCAEEIPSLEVVHIG